MSSVQPLERAQAVESCPPLLRWAGGKRTLLKRLIPLLPNSFGTYYEPMLGSGALFFACAPQRARLADFNSDLINFYRVVRDQPKEFLDEVEKMSLGKRAYHLLRKRRPSTPLDRAATLFYLVRLSFNGLYRVNHDGFFNVPFGGRRPKELLNLDHLLRISSLLKRAELASGDFRQNTPGARPGDFVYFDPPYPRGAAKEKGFARYTELGFSIDDHRRLAIRAAQLADRGVHVMITEAHRREVLSLFSSSFTITRVRSRALFAASGAARRDAHEVILTSYKIPEVKNREL
jgi:DNA adenine methylase